MRRRRERPGENPRVPSSFPNATPAVPACRRCILAARGERPRVADRYRRHEPGIVELPPVCQAFCPVDLVAAQEWKQSLAAEPRCEPRGRLPRVAALPVRDPAGPAGTTSRVEQQSSSPEVGRRRKHEPPVKLEPVRYRPIRGCHRVACSTHCPTDFRRRRGPQRHDRQDGHGATGRRAGAAAPRRST